MVKRNYTQIIKIHEIQNINKEKFEENSSRYYSKVEINRTEMTNAVWRQHLK